MLHNLDHFLSSKRRQTSLVSDWSSDVCSSDLESGFGPIVKYTQVQKFDYLIGRFLGAFIAASIAFIAIPFAMWLGSLMPWLDQETLGPTTLSHYLYAYFVIALPGIFLTSSIFFAVATLTRSMMYSYLGVVAFLVMYLVFNAVVGSQPELRNFASYAEPFGFAAIGNETRYWTVTESNSLLPPLSGTILINKLIWLGVSLLALAVFLNQIHDDIVGFRQTIIAIDICWN